MIEVQGVSKTFPLNRKQKKEMNTQASEIAAVQDISFRCRPGRIFSLLGPNGAGKTTTLRMIATILRPSAGEIRVNGFDVLTEGRQVRSQIGFLTGSTGLYDRLTPLELVKYFADLYRIEAGAFNARKDYLFELLGIHEFGSKRIGQLSTGMKQKVSIARTLIHDPPVIVFDEPTSGLDVITAESIIALIRQCKAEEKTIIFSSHIMSEVELLCDDLAIIHKGKIIFADNMESFRKSMQTDSLTREFIRIVSDHQ
jgi:sodium transport system ATP-binding protein